MLIELSNVCINQTKEKEEEEDMPIDQKEKTMSYLINTG